MVVMQAVKTMSLMCKSNTTTSMWWFGYPLTWTNQAKNLWQDGKHFSGIIILKTKRFRIHEEKKNNIGHEIQHLSSDLVSH